MRNLWLNATNGLISQHFPTLPWLSCHVSLPHGSVHVEYPVSVSIPLTPEPGIGYTRVAIGGTSCSRLKELSRFQLGSEGKPGLVVSVEGELQVLGGADV